MEAQQSAKLSGVARAPELAAPPSSTARGVPAFFLWSLEESAWLELLATIHRVASSCRACSAGIAPRRAHESSSHRVLGLLTIEASRGWKGIARAGVPPAGGERCLRTPFDKGRWLVDSFPSHGTPALFHARPSAPERNDAPISVPKWEILNFSNFRLGWCLPEPTVDLHSSQLNAQAGVQGGVSSILATKFHFGNGGGQQ